MFCPSRRLLRIEPIRWLSSRLQKRKPKQKQRRNLQLIQMPVRLYRFKIQILGFLTQILRPKLLNKEVKMMLSRKKEKMENLLIKMSNNKTILLQKLMGHSWKTSIPKRQLDQNRYNQLYHSQKYLKVTLEQAREVREFHTQENTKLKFGKRWLLPISKMVYSLWMISKNRVRMLLIILITANRSSSNSLRDPVESKSWLTNS